MPTPARLLLLSERFAPDLGGVARSATRTAAALAALGVRVDVLAWTRQLPPGALETTGTEDSRPGITSHRLGLFGEWDLSLQHTLNVLDWLQERERFDAVWGHYLFPAGFAAVWFAESAGLPSVVSARGNDVDRLMFPPGDFARLLWTLERATVVNAVSKELARKINLLLGRDAGVRLVPNVVDLDVFCPGPPDEALRRRLGVLPVEAVLGFSGELRHKKGIDFLLAGIHDVRLVRPACLLVIGEARPDERAKLAAFAAEHPDDAARVLVTGHLDDPAAVARHLRLCDLFLQPSVWDGMPNALLEAMACGRIPLASDAGGIPEVVVHGESGFLLKRSQLGRLGEAALELLALPAEKRSKLEAAARERVSSEFHAGVEAEALRQVLVKLR